jgi:DNA-binding MarR family transcriptional regulator
MSRPDPGDAPREAPLIALVNRADRELQADMVRHARAVGYEAAKLAHNAVFGTLPVAGARTADLAARAGITRQSMGEVVRELVDLGLVTMTVDPDDRRAKLVTYTDAGLAQVQLGRAHIADFDDRMVAELGEEGYDSLRHGLDTIVKVLQADGAPKD